MYRPNDEVEQERLEERLKEIGLKDFKVFSYWLFKLLKNNYINPEQNCKNHEFQMKFNSQFLSHITELFSEKALFGRELHGESGKHDVLGAQTTFAETGSAREESASFLN